MVWEAKVIIIVVCTICEIEQRWTTECRFKPI